MKKILKLAVGFVLLYTSLIKSVLSRRGVYKGVVILSFHKVVNSPYFRHHMTVSSGVFSELLDYLQKTVDIVPLDDLLDINKVANRSSRLKVVLTFDDGYYDNFTLAFPELKKRGIPATIFLSSGYIDTDKLLWWDMVDLAISSYDLLDKNIKDELDALVLELLNEYNISCSSYDDHLKNKVVNSIKKPPYFDK